MRACSPAIEAAPRRLYTGRVGAVRKDRAAARAASEHNELDATVHLSDTSTSVL